MTANGLKVAQVAESWLGTPFFPHMAKKGVGVDCVQLAKGICIEAGLGSESDADFPPYRLDVGLHLDSSIVLRWLEQSKFFYRVTEISPGCILTVRIGRIEHHVGVVLSDCKRFVHAVREYGVITGTLRDSTWSSRITTIWEPL